MDRFIVVTRNSVYTVKSTSVGNFVTGRATFDGDAIIPDQQYAGKVVLEPEVGGLMCFNDAVHGPITTSTVLLIIAI